MRNTIVSLQQLNFPNDRYEIIVIDNNSTDDTRRVVEEGKQQGKKEIIYCKELRVGLHYARHAGAQIAKGDILAYIDDDAICDPDWLLELTRPYTDPKVGCVGGKILPRFETKDYLLQRIGGWPSLSGERRCTDTEKGHTRLYGQ